MPVTSPVTAYRKRGSYVSRITLKGAYEQYILICLDVRSKQACCCHIEQGVSYESDKAISRVTLLKTGAVTHSFNNDQRFLELEFSKRDNNQLDIALPKDSRLATPGYYMLFLIDAAGVPSKAEIFHFAPPATQPDQQELVLDGGFELPSIGEIGSREWHDYSAGERFGPWSVDSGSVSLHLNRHRGLGKGAAGVQHLDLNGYSSGEVSQVLSKLEVGHRYTLRFRYARHDLAGPNAALGVAIAGERRTMAVATVGSASWVSGSLGRLRGRAPGLQRHWRQGLLRHSD